MASTRDLVSVFALTFTYEFDDEIDDEEEDVDEGEMSKSLFTAGIAKSSLLLLLYPLMEDEAFVVTMLFVVVLVIRWGVATYLFMSFVL